MHGPGVSAYGLNWSPTWPVRPIPVLDTIARTLRPRRQRAWRTARNTALDLWRPAGIDFAVTERAPEGYPRFDSARAHTEVAYMDTLIIPETLRLMRTAYIGRGGGAFAWWTLQADPGAFAGFTLPVWFWARTPTSQAGIVCHEVGHCLGLDHREPSKSVMAGGSKPDEHDFESVRAWYQL